jgi:hypothetical protein
VFYVGVVKQKAVLENRPMLALRRRYGHASWTKIRRGRKTDNVFARATSCVVRTVLHPDILRREKGVDVEEPCTIAEARETFDGHKPTRMETWDDGRTFSFFFPLAFGKGFKVYKSTV